MSDTSIKDILATAALDRLTEVLIEGVPEDDPTRAGIAKLGKLQANPVPGRVNVMVKFADEKWPDALYTGLPGGKDQTPYEMGDNGLAAFEWHRYCLEFYLFLKGEQQAAAQSAASVVYSRAKHALRTMRMPEGDTFGSVPLMIQVYDGFLTHEGGPPNNFIFKGELRFEFLTHYEPQD